jgi:hypothetical protein
VRQGRPAGSVHRIGDADNTSGNYRGPEVLEKRFRPNLRWQSQHHPDICFLILSAPLCLKIFLVQLYGNFKTKVFLLLGYIVLLLFSFALVWFECFSFSWYMGFELKTRQVLYHLSHPPSSHFFPFFFFLL